VNLDELQAVATSTPVDIVAVRAYTCALFWGGEEGQAVDVALKVLRKSPRSEEVRQLVLSFVDVLGPRHPRYAAARRKFSNALFI